MTSTPVSRPFPRVGPGGEKPGDPHPQCGYCGNTEGVFWRAARTAYCDYYPEYTIFDLIKHDGDPPLPPDPNAPTPLCEQCTKEYEEYWDEMWAEANYGRM